MNTNTLRMAARKLQSVPALMGRVARKLRKDDRGAAIIEYALIAGLIIVVCIGLITTFGTRVVARWNSVNAANL